MWLNLDPLHLPLLYTRHSPLEGPPPSSVWEVFMSSTCRSLSFKTPTPCSLLPLSLPTVSDVRTFFKLHRLHCGSYFGSSVAFISLTLTFFYSVVINSFTLSNICYNTKPGESTLVGKRQLMYLQVFNVSGLEPTNLFWTTVTVGNK
jgi:hypothetical protein